jgi:hypothetical protein
MPQPAVACTCGPSSHFAHGAFAGALCNVITSMMVMLLSRGIA